MSLKESKATNKKTSTSSYHQTGKNTDLNKKSLRYGLVGRIPQTYDFKITSTFFKVMEVDLGYAFTTNNYNSGALSNTFSTHSPKVEIDLDIYKGLKLNADYTYNSYLNQASGIRSDFEFLNAFLGYQGKKSPWEFRVSVWNILDTRSIRRDSFSENLISTYSYLVQPRYGLLTVKYDL